MNAEVSTLDARREALLARFESWPVRSTADWLVSVADEFPERPFVITDERTLTYRETLEWAKSIARGLRARGLKPGEHVGLLMANVIEFLPVKFAIALAGGVAVPLNFLYRAQELAYVLEQSEVAFLLTMDSYIDLDYQNLLDEVAPGWDDGTKAAESLPSLREVVVVGAARPGVLDLTALEEAGRDLPDADFVVSTDPLALSDILYTSGTTGSPKGVMVTHDAVFRTGYGSALTRAYEDGRRILFSLPCYHMFGYIEGVLSAMMVGGSVVLLPRFSAEGYLAGIERHRATDILCVPTMTVALLEHPELAKYDLSSLRAILSGSAPGPAWLWDQVTERLGATEIVTGYGMTECGGAMTLTLPEDSSETTATRVGRVKFAGSAGLSGAMGPLCEYRVIDPLTGEFLPDGEEGEFVSQGPTHMLGYWNKPAETAETLQDGWLHSGDLGRVHPDGYLEITGRTKELYKSGGELVMPKEIEELLDSLPGISQVYAIGIPDERWGDAGCVCVVRSPESSISAEEILDYCRQHLARFKVPKHVLFMADEALPRTPTGKIQKYMLVKHAKETLQS